MTIDVYFPSITPNYVFEFGLSSNHESIFQRIQITTPNKVQLKNGIERWKWIYLFQR